MPERLDDLLWQGGLPPDLERVRAAAARLPLPAEPDWDAPRLRVVARPHSVARPLAGLAAAAALVALVGLAAFARDAWRVETLAGRPSLSGVALAGRVATGGAITTDGASRARLDLPVPGELTLETGGCVRRVRGVGDERRLRLEYGTLSAAIAASSRPLVVVTPLGAATSLGGAFALAVSDSGTGRLDVASGRVAFENGGLESRLPAGFGCALTPAGAGVPRRADASEAFLAAVAVADNPACQADDFAPLLEHAGAGDAITLWHFLPRVRGPVRRQVAERLDALAPMPAGVTLDRVLALEPFALDAWWNALGAGPREAWSPPPR